MCWCLSIIELKNARWNIEITSANLKLSIIDIHVCFFTSCLFISVFLSLSDIYPSFLSRFFPSVFLPYWFVLLFLSCFLSFFLSSFLNPARLPFLIFPLSTTSQCVWKICPFTQQQDLQPTRVGTLIVATIYLQLIQNRYMFRSFTLLQCSHHHCVQLVASDVEVVEYL